MVDLQSLKISKALLGFESTRHGQSINPLGVDLRIVFAERSIFKAFMKTTVLFALCLSAVSLCGKSPKFQMQTIDDKVGIGYGIQLADMNADGKTDILLVDKDKVAWYENPHWQKHIVVNHLTKRDHVCLTARDLDGDGKAELAMGGEWNPGDTLQSGAVFYLSPNKSGKGIWSHHPLPHEPTTHRMHWVKGKGGAFYLMVKPLHGRGNKNNAGAPLKVLAYQIPDSPEKSPWETTLVCDFLHNSHNFHPVNWDSDEEEEILITGMEGTWLIDQRKEKWIAKLVAKPFGGEVRDGKDAQGNYFVTTIEPRHGSVVACYLKVKDAWERVVLDTTLKDGHALGTGDFLGLGYDQIVAGWRAMRPSGEPGLKLFVPEDKTFRNWKEFRLSSKEIAVEDLKVGDLNGDGKPEIVAAGRQTHNLVILWNQSGKP